MRRSPLKLSSLRKNLIHRRVALCVRGVALAVASVAVQAFAELRINPPDKPGVNVQLMPKSGESSPAPSSNPSVWHFQAVYGISSADVETPAWDTKTEPATAVQKSTTGVFTENRFSHSMEMPLTNRQSLRMGLSLFSAQSYAASGWVASLTGKSKASDWRTWGLGTDIFLVRHTSPNLDLDAGLHADYFVSGVITLPVGESASPALQNAARLEQKMGWRLAFSGGIGGLYIGPVGVILRLTGHVIQSQFKGHTAPLRVQGIQVQAGAGLALGRGEP